VRTVIILLFLSSTSAMAQPEPPAAFEVASVKSSQPGPESIEAGPASLTMRNVRMIACIGWAFNIQDAQVAGPNWMSQISFDIFAKSAGPATEAQLRRMLQALLADRFKLTFHRETREIRSLILVVSGKGHKLKPAEKPGEPSFRTGNMSLTGEGATLGELTQFLSSTLHEVVIDQTGLRGLFNYTLDVNAYLTEETRKSTGTGPPLEANGIVAQAMQEQLGLKVEAKKTPVSMLIVEHIEKSPTEN
jgi:uncharacterized protein (TIGR03435 family)